MSSAEAEVDRREGKKNDNRKIYRDYVVCRENMCQENKSIRRTREKKKKMCGERGDSED